MTGMDVLVDDRADHRSKWEDAGGNGSDSALVAKVT
jgi:hypothetical protein